MREYVNDPELDVEGLHRTLLREPNDPNEGDEKAPWWVWVVTALALFWGGWYLGRHGGSFSSATHLAFETHQPTNSGAPVVIEVDGEQIFTQRCQSCHQADGQGIAGVFPPIRGSEWVTGDEETLVRIILNGLNGPVTVNEAQYDGAMPAWRNILDDREIAAVVTYIRQWSPNDAAAVSPGYVAQVRDDSRTRAAPWTAVAIDSARRR